jgi:hypothetical protein
MVALSEWLQLMLAEIARKREDQELANAEDIRRASETRQSSSSPDKEARASRG